MPKTGSSWRNRNASSAGGGLLTADIDVEFLEHERINSSTFSMSAGLASGGYRCIETLPESSAVPATGLLRPLARNPFVPTVSVDLEERCREIFAIQSAGLASRLAHIGCSTAVIGGIGRP